MKKLWWLLMLIPLLSVLSLFLWAAFDYAWWVPIGERDMGRGFALMMLHIVGFAASPAVLAVIVGMDDDA